MVKNASLGFDSELDSFIRDLSLYIQSLKQDYKESINISVPRSQAQGILTSKQQKIRRELKKEIKKLLRYYNLD